MLLESHPTSILQGRELGLFPNYNYLRAPGANPAAQRQAQEKEGEKRDEVPWSPARGPSRPSKKRVWWFPIRFDANLGAPEHPGITSRGPLGLMSTQSLSLEESPSSLIEEGVGSWICGQEGAHREPLRAACAGAGPLGLAQGCSAPSLRATPALPSLGQLGLPLRLSCRAPRLPPPQGPGKGRGSALGGKALPLKDCKEEARLGNGAFCFTRRAELPPAFGRSLRSSAALDQTKKTHFCWIKRLAATACTPIPRAVPQGQRGEQLRCGPRQRRSGFMALETFGAKMPEISLVLSR